MLPLGDVLPANPDAAALFQLTVIRLTCNDRKLGGQATRQVVHPPLLYRIAWAVGFLGFQIDM